MSDQMMLLPQDPPETRLGKIPLESVLDQAKAQGLPPTAQFVETVKALGVIQPVIVARCVPAEGEERGPNEYRLCAGRRRVLAADDAGLKTIDAKIYPEGAVTPEILTLIENEHRSPNRMADLNALERLLDRDGVTMKVICEELKLNKASVEKSLTLLNLIPELRDAFQKTKIAPTVALKAAKLSPRQQRLLLDPLEQNERVTGPDVKEVKQAGKMLRSQELSQRLFGNARTDGTFNTGRTSPGDDVIDPFSVLCEIVDHVREHGRLDMTDPTPAGAELFSKACRATGRPEQVETEGSIAA